MEHLGDMQLQHEHSQTDTIIFAIGAWMTNFILIFFIKFFFGIIPGISPELSWTLTTLTYNIVSPTLFLLGSLHPCVNARAIHSNKCFSTVEPSCNFTNKATPPLGR